MKPGIGGVVYKEGVITTLKKIFEVEGMIGYFKGNGTNVLKIVPHNAIRFFSFEVIKQKQKINNQKSNSVFKAISNPESNLSTLQRLWAGGCAGGLACIFTHPLDLIRTRLALQTTQQRYTGIMNCVKLVSREEGYLGLYKGMGVALISAVPATAINFTTYETLKELTTRLGGNVIALASVNGAVAGALSMTVLYPLDLCKRRLMVAGVEGFPSYKGPIECLIDTYKREGVRGLYRGISLAYLKVIPAISLTFLSYEATLSFLNWR